MITNIETVFGTEGSGNQKKCWIGNNLIKLNSKYHEDEKEYSASRIGNLFGLNVVNYEKGMYTYNNTTYKGCECKSFISKHEYTVTLYWVISQCDFVVSNNLSAKDYFEKTLTAISTVLKIPKIVAAKHLMEMLVFDYIICNNDRHLTNIEFIYNKETACYTFTPIFDNGHSFLMRNSIPTKKQLEMEFYKFKTRPFSTNPKANLIDIPTAKAYAESFKKQADLLGGIDSLQINEFHKYVAKRQLESLLNM